MTFEQFISGLVWLIPVFLIVVFTFVFWTVKSDNRKSGEGMWWLKPPVDDEHATQHFIPEPEKHKPKTMQEMSELPMAQRPYHQKRDHIHTTTPLDEAVRKAENPVVERPFRQPNHPHPHVNLPGKATHWVPASIGVTAPMSVCGLIGPAHWTGDPRKTDCQNCRRTWEWKNRIEQTGNQK